MSYRWPAVAAALLTAVYAVVYVSAVRSQQGTIAWWYVVALVVAMVLVAVGATGMRPRTTLAVGTVVLGLSFVVGLLSVGLLVLPALAASGIALALSLQAPASSRSPSGPTRPVYGPRQD